MKRVCYPHPSILTRPELKKGHAVIEASAGTGKTYTLEHLVLDLIITDQARIEEILVVTFTDAATRELRERVRALLRRVCDHRSAEDDAQFTDACWEITDEIRERLREALFCFDRASISTIHGFCQQVLTEQAFLAGRLFELEHADGAEQFGRAFREELRLVLVDEGPVGDAVREWIESEYTLQQLQDLLYRCHREGVPDRCPITPLWDPQGFMQAVKSLPDSELLKAAVIDHFADNLTRKGHEKIIDSLFEAVDRIRDNPKLQEAYQVFMDWAIKKCAVNKINVPRIDHLLELDHRPGVPAVLQELVRIIEKMLQLAAVELSFFAYELLPRVQARLTARKRALGIIDYDDMLLGVQEALSGDNAAVLLETLRKRWKYALVDEFQDTDPVQWDIFRRIFVEGADQQRLMVIGDPKQAIYSFRGADVHTYEQAKQYLVSQCHASRLPLVKNYRSTTELIDAINDILTVQDDTGRGFFSGLNRYEDLVECGDLSRTALESGKPGAPIHLVHLYGETEKLSAGVVRQGTAHFIAGEIKRLTDPVNGLKAGIKGGEVKPVRLSDIYILTRTISEGLQIGKVLRHYGISHAFYKQDDLFKTREADEIHRLLLAINAPADPAIRMSAWLTAFFEVSLDELPAWQEAGENHQLVNRLQQWKQLADAQDWTRLFDQILNGSGLIRRLIFQQAERELTNYLHIFELLQAEAYARPVTLRDLARGLKARIDGRKQPEGREGDLQRLETDQAAVQILTMHKAKGLEAEVVFIAGGFSNPFRGGINLSVYHSADRRCLHIGTSTGSIARAIEREIDEENQRLAYVAITRARSRLYLPYFGEARGTTPENRFYGYNRLGRFYKTLQRQLDLLRADGRLDDRSCFRFREASCRVRLPYESAVELKPKSPALATELFEQPVSSAARAMQIEPYHRGILLTSYSRIKRGQGYQPPPADSDQQDIWRIAEAAGEELSTGMTAAAAGDHPMDTGAEIPGGKEVGICLHTLLEETPAEEISGRSFEEWAALPAVQQRAESTIRQYGISEEHRPAVLKLIYDVLITPICVPAIEGNAVLEMPGGFVSGTRQCVELFFTYPIPEAFHPPIAAVGGGTIGGGLQPPYKAARGYLQGLVDLLFEHEGRVYMLDWKSDRLPVYCQTSLDEHVEANYRLQAQVYALAVLRLLGIASTEHYAEKFGGIIYVFMRGMRSANQVTEGIWFSQPSWNSLVLWENEMISRKQWGGPVIKNQKMQGTAEPEGGQHDG